MRPRGLLGSTSQLKIRENDKWARFDPFDGFKVGFVIDFDHPVFKVRATKGRTGLLHNLFR